MKRTFDIIISSLLLILLLPIFIIIAILIKMDTEGPVFFRQTRVGLRGRLFKIYKFRTMQAKASGPKITIGNDPRITRIGRFLRNTKIDELPQLINVIKGDMSLVGPRPEVPEYIKLYKPEEREIILSVRPGITDLASIEFRWENELLARAQDPQKVYIEQIMPRKFELYKYYVQNQSFWLDLKILARTASQLVRRS